MVVAEVAVRSGLPARKPRNCRRAIVWRFEISGPLRVIWVMRISIVSAPPIAILPPPKWVAIEPLHCCSLLERCQIKSVKCRKRRAGSFLSGFLAPEYALERCAGLFEPQRWWRSTANDDTSHVH